MLGPRVLVSVRLAVPAVSGSFCGSASCTFSSFLNVSGQKTGLGVLASSSVTCRENLLSFLTGKKWRVSLYLETLTERGWYLAGCFSIPKLIKKLEVRHSCPSLLTLIGTHSELGQTPQAGRRHCLHAGSADWAGGCKTTPPRGDWGRKSEDSDVVMCVVHLSWQLILLGFRCGGAGLGRVSASFTEDKGHWSLPLLRRPRVSVGRLVGWRLPFSAR